MPSTTPPVVPLADTPAEEDPPPYIVQFDRHVARKIQRYGLQNDDFVPLIAEMIEDLEQTPKNYPEKHEVLADARAYHIAYRGETWRAVFLVDDDFGEVYILSFGPHDEAYIQAERRI